MDNSRSLEALYQDGTGMVSLPKKSFKASIEGYDGFDDILYTNLAKSEEDLAFLDTYQMIEAKNAADKMKMCKKLSANYGTRSGIPTAAATSIESLCRMMSLEADEQSNAAGVNTGNEQTADKPVDKPGDNPGDKKKEGFFKTVFGAIRKFFERIWEVFMRIIGDIKGLFKKKEAAKTTDAGNVNVNDTNASGKTKNATDTTADDIRNRQANTKTKLNLDYKVWVDIGKFDPTGIKKFAEKYGKTSTAVNSFATKLRNAEQIKVADKETGKMEDQSVANGRRNALMEKEGKALIETIEATSSIVRGVADRRTSLAARADAKSIDAALKAASKELTFEVGSDNAYTVLESLFGVTRDKDLEKDANAYANAEKNKSTHGNISNRMILYATRVTRMKNIVLDSISKIPNDLSNPHTTMVRVCKEFENKINSYISGIGKGNATEFYTTLTVLASALKVCTKIEQVVVKAVNAMIRIVTSID